MKKLITFILATVILCTNCFAVLLVHSGDVNDDGVISIIDIAKSRSHIVGNTMLTDAELMSADISNDQNVDVVDIMLMRQSVTNRQGQIYTFGLEDTDYFADTDTEKPADSDVNFDTETVIDTDGTSFDSGSKTDTDVNAEPYEKLIYYRSFLETQTLLNVYDAIVDGIAECSTEIRFNAVSENDLIRIYNYVVLDHPEFYYVKSSYSYLINNLGNVIGFLPKYTEGFDTVQKVKEGYSYIDSQVDAIIKEAMKKPTRYERIMYAYDALKVRFKYDVTPDSYNIYGALKYGGAVCEGYSETFAYILDKMEIQNILVSGTIKNSNIPHRWNMLYIDDKWYHFDVTWDDNYNDETIEYSYFGISTADIENSRYIDELAPVSYTNDLNFYYKNNLVVNSFDFDEICAVADKSVKFSQKTVAFKFVNRADYAKFISDSSIRSKLIRRYVGNVAYTYITKQYTDLNIVEITWYVN